MLEAIFVFLFAIVFYQCIILSRKERKSFITGSSAYGSYRTAKSDLDLVIYIDEDEILKIEKINGVRKKYGKLDAVVVKTGSVDLVLVSDKNEFDRLKRNTEVLKNMKNIDRDKAIKVMNE